MASDCLLSSRSHTNINLTSSSSHLGWTSLAKIPFPSSHGSSSTGQNDPRWLRQGPRWLQDGPKTGQDDPKMAQSGLLKRRRHNNIELISPSPPFGKTFLAKILFSSPQDPPKTGQDDPKITPKWPNMAPRWAKMTPRLAKMAPSMARMSLRWPLEEKTS